jgi:hypothetical protein
MLGLNTDNDDEPYGLGFWHWLYWLVFFKRGGVQDQALSLTVAASPKTEVIYEDASKKKDAENLAAKISQGSKSLAHTQDIVVKYLESTRTGFPDFAAFVEWCNRAIVETILLQNVTSKEAAFKGDVQEHTKEGLIASCAKELFESFTDEVIAKLCFYRFGADVNPPALRMVEEPEDAKLVLERDKLALEIGLKRTEQSRKELFPDYEELQADVKITLLNGAQQTALQALVKDCAANLIPPDTAEAMTLTYGISLEQAKTFIDPIRKTLEESKAQAEQQAAAADPFADPNAQPDQPTNPVLDQLGLDPTQLSADEVEFGKGDGYPCGKGYISKWKKCSKGLEGQAKDYTGYLKAKLQSGETLRRREKVNADWMGIKNESLDKSLQVSKTTDIAKEQTSNKDKKMNNNPTQKYFADTAIKKAKTEISDFFQSFDISKEDSNLLSDEIVNRALDEKVKKIPKNSPLAGTSLFDQQNSLVLGAKIIANKLDEAEELDKLLDSLIQKARMSSNA